VKEEGGQGYYCAEYFHFMINQLNETIRYSDAKHTLGLTLVVSFLLMSNEFVFKEVNQSSGIIDVMVDINILSGLAAMLFGYVGIFPHFVSPSFLARMRRPKPAGLRRVSIFYFKEINRIDAKTFCNLVDKAFPNCDLSDYYKTSAVEEIQALSAIIVRKFMTFRLLLYALFVYFATLSWLFLSTVLVLPRGTAG
jgi:hypothetical protein